MCVGCLLLTRFTEELERETEKRGGGGRGEREREKFAGQCQESTQHSSGKIGELLKAFVLPLTLPYWPPHLP